MSTPRLASAARSSRAHRVDDVLVEREARLDDRRQVRARDPRQRAGAGPPRRARGRRRRSRPSSGVASSPTRPLCVAATGLLGLRADDADHVDADVVPKRSCSAGSAAAVAELHATTSSFAPRSSSSSAIWSANPCSSSGERVAVREARGVAQVQEVLVRQRTSSSCRTVSPPTPESKTPTGRRRTASSAARAATGRGRARGRGPAGSRAGGIAPVWQRARPGRPAAAGRAWHGADSRRRRRRPTSSMAPLSLSTMASAIAVVVEAAGWRRRRRRARPPSAGSGRRTRPCPGRASPPQGGRAPPRGRGRTARRTHCPILRRGGAVVPAARGGAVARRVSGGTRDGLQRGV